MDTISRENNSLLPIAGVIVGGLGLLLGGYSAISLSKVKTQLAAHEDKLSQLDQIASNASSALNTANNVQQNLDKRVAEIQAAFTAVGNEIGTLKGDVATLKESRASVGKRGGRGGPVVAGPGEYVVKPGDSLRKIARSAGCTLAELEAVNPGVDSRHLKVGQKLKLPEKGPAAAEPAAAPAAPAAAQ